jgi:molecular chaperone DnaJ
MVKRTATYYQVLGLEPQVSSMEIKKAYRKLVKDYHPDVDYSESDASRRGKRTEYMMDLNEAYATLSDKSKRATYDALIGANGRGRATRVSMANPVEEEEARVRYLRKIFHPSRQDIVRVLGKFKQKLRELSLDIFDDQLVATFEQYVNEVETVLFRAANALSSEKSPDSLEGAVQMMRYSIAQAADGLDEKKRFCQNYDYDHLAMAGNLFRIANDLLKKSLRLSKI